MKTEPSSNPNKLNGQPSLWRWVICVFVFVQPVLIWVLFQFPSVAAFYLAYVACVVVIIVIISVFSLWHSLGWKFFLAGIGIEVVFSVLVGLILVLAIYPWAEGCPIPDPGSNYQIGCSGLKASVPTAFFWFWGMVVFITASLITLWGVVRGSRQFACLGLLSFLLIPLSNVIRGLFRIY